MKMWYARMALLIVLFLSFSPAVRSQTLTRDNVLFYAPLDGSLEAKIARGSAKPLGPARVEYTAGYKGRGILTGGAGSELRYATDGNLNLDAGSVAMWIKPTDWQNVLGGALGPDSNMRFFFRTGETTDAGGPGAGNFVWLYKYFLYSVYFLTQQDCGHRGFYYMGPGSGDMYLSPVKFSWAADQWAHVVAAWSANQMSIYVNGQFVGTVYVPTSRLLKKLSGEFIIGGKNLRNGGTPDTVIDEVVILDRPLTPGQAKALHQKGLEGLLAADEAAAVPHFTVTANYNPATDRLSVTTEIVGRRTEEIKNLSITYEVQPVNHRKPLIQKILTAEMLRQVIPIDSSSLALGDYRVVAELKENQKTLVRSEATVAKVAKPEWVGNQLGITPNVPAPWTPLELKEKTLSCWGRTTTWATGAFPARIVSQGQSLLARPITLTGKFKGRTYPLSQVSLTWDKTAPARVDFTARGTLGEVFVTVKGWMEYDGFTWYEVLVGDKKTTSGQILEALWLEIPLNPKVATLMDGKAPTPRSGQVCPFQGSMLFEPVLWFGNEKAGLQWCTEDFKDWNLKDMNTMCSFQTGTKAHVLRFNLVDIPTPLSRPLRYAMGIEATPVKPMAKGARGWEMPMNKVNCTPADGRKGWQYFLQSWNTLPGQSDGPYGYMYPSDATYRYYENARLNNQQIWIYWPLHLLWKGDPVLKSFSEWGKFDPKAHPYSHIALDLSDPYLRDYLLWMNWKLLQDKKISQGTAGYYVDCSESGWRPNNRFDILGTRELKKRFCVMVKTHWPHILISNHQSDDPYMAELAFADMNLTGEHFNDNPVLFREKNYHHVLDLDAARAEVYGAAFGIPRIFLPEITRAGEGHPDLMKKLLGKEGIPPAEHLIGMLWVHDVTTWHAYTNLDPLRQAARTKDAFGWDKDTDFTGYWESERIVKTSADRSPVVTSVFTRKGKVMFVVMNNSDQDARVELKPRWSALGIPTPTKATDAYAEQAEPKPGPGTLEIPVEKGVITLSVKARNFRSVVVR